MAEDDSTLINHYEKIIGLANLIPNGTISTVTAETSTLASQYNTALTQVQTAAGIDKESISSGCKTSCTGLCSTARYGGCKSG